MKKMQIIGILLLVIQISYCHVSYQPEQVHISFGENVSEIVVTWSTIDDTPNSIVEYGINGMILTANGTSEKFVDGGPEKHTQYIHRVRLTDLTPSSKYGKSFHSLNVTFSFLYVTLCGKLQLILINLM